MIIVFFSILLLVTAPGSLYLLFITVSSVLYAHRKGTATPNHQDVTPCKIAVVIPAHNEELSIESTIHSIQDCEPHKGSVEIVVVADNCTDNTANISSQNGCVVIERNNTELLGKGYALEHALSSLCESDFELFLIVDADTICEPNILVEVENQYASGHQAIQVKNLVSKSPRGNYAKITSLGFKAMNLVRPSARSYWGLSVGIFGTGFALSKNLLANVPYQANSITEDFEYHLKLVEAGHRSNLSIQTAVYSEMSTHNHQAQAQRSRWEGGRLRIAKINIGRLIRKIIVGQFQLIEPLFELLLLPLSYHVLILILLLLSPGDVHNLFGLLGLGIAFVHLLWTILFGGGGPKELKILLKIPSYLFWKITMLWKVIKQSSDRAQWIRTERKK